jgi:hypothetical protein
MNVKAEGSFKNDEYLLVYTTYRDKPYGVHTEVDASLDEIKKRVKELILDKLVDFGSVEVVKIVKVEEYVVQKKEVIFIKE